MFVSTALMLYDSGLGLRGFTDDMTRVLTMALTEYGFMAAVLLVIREAERLPQVLYARCLVQHSE